MAEGVVFQRRMVQEQVLVAQDPPPWTLEGGNVAVQADIGVALAPYTVGEKPVAVGRQLSGTLEDGEEGMPAVGGLLPTKELSRGLTLPREGERAPLVWTPEVEIPQKWQTSVQATLGL